MAQDDTLEKLLILAGAGIGLWYLYEQGFLYQWTGIAALYPGTLPSSTSSTASTTGASTGAATSTTPAATSSTPAVATFQVIGAATADINNSLYANVSINGGAVQGLAVIPSNGTVWLGNQNITNTLVAEGINIDSLIAAFQAAYTPSSSSSSGSSGSSGSSSSSPDCGGGLTASDAATLVYDPSTISASDMDCVSASLDTELQSGQISTILGTSVLAYMLGWGGASSGETQSVYGLTYKYNGSDWILQSSGTSGFGSISWGTRVPMEGIHGMGYGRVRRGWLT